MAPSAGKVPQDGAYRPSLPKTPATPRSADTNLSPTVDETADRFGCVRQKPQRRHDGAGQFRLVRCGCNRPSSLPTKNTSLCSLQPRTIEYLWATCPPTFLPPQFLKASLCLRLPKMLPGQIADPAPGLLFLLLRGVKFIDGFVLL